MKRIACLALALFPAFILCSDQLAGAQSKLCVRQNLKIKRKKVPFTSAIRLADSCPKGYKELVDLADYQTTSTQIQSVAGEYLAYGDGSGGNYSASSADQFNVLSADNRNFTDFSVPSGATLYVESGSIIRCTGTFTNEGTVEVMAFSASAKEAGQLKQQTYAPGQNGPGPSGLSGAVAGMADLGLEGAEVSAGDGGESSDAGWQKGVLRYGKFGGGGGGGEPGFPGQAGGGTFHVYCKGGIVNKGTIRADADINTAAGGAGGGIIVLASKTSISNSGTLSANGGAGADPTSQSCGGGGGGGGLVQLYAPSVSNTGSISVSGGQGGAAGSAGTVKTSPRFGGHGGGASIGSGGAGAAAQTDGSCLKAEDGGDGGSNTALIDPTALLR